MLPMREYTTTMAGNRYRILLEVYCKIVGRIDNPTYKDFKMSFTKVGP